LRGLTAAARAARSGDERALSTALKRDAEVLGSLLPVGDLAAISEAAAAAYRTALSPEGAGS
jgi:hypothetical protein